MSNENEYTIKVVILGEGRVGKTSILERHFKNTFDAGQKSTVNSAFFEKTIKMKDGRTVKFKFWDTAGQEKFDAVQSMYYRDSSGAILVYDLTNKDTFTKVEKWIKEIKATVTGEISFIICGNKFDLVDKEVIDEQNKETLSFCQKYNLKHFFTSAKTNYNIPEAFDHLTKKIIESMPKNNKPKGKKGISIEKEDEPNNSGNENNKKGCC